MAIDNAKGNVILFLDDDAVAEERWVEKYDLFNSLPNVGGIGGKSHKAYIKSGMFVKTYEPFYDETTPRNAFYRKPLTEYVNYHGWIARSGFWAQKLHPAICFSLRCWTESTWGC
jgi:hypothetical protein